MNKEINVVLVHGGFVDGSGWRGVYDILRRDGFNVSIVQNPTVTLSGDVAATKMVLDEQPGDALLVGHSYGGAVITGAGTHPKVRGLVYITAFMPDKGESVGTLLGKIAPGTPQPPILPPKDGFLLLDKTKFAEAFAGDVDKDTAQFMAFSQVPWGVSAPGEAIAEPAWRSKPTWYLHVTEDKMIPIALQRFMAERAGSKTAEVGGSHAIYVSNPSAVATLVETAANAVMAKA